MTAYKYECAKINSQPFSGLQMMVMVMMALTWIVYTNGPIGVSDLRKLKCASRVPGLRVFSLVLLVCMKRCILIDWVYLCSTCSTNLRRTLESNINVYR